MLLATLRGQGRGRTVIPGFAVRYISIMLPSQTRHLMCKKKSNVRSWVDPAPSFSTYAVAGGALYMTSGGLPEKRGQLLSPLPCSIFLFFFQVASLFTTGTEAK